MRKSMISPISSAVVPDPAACSACTSATRASRERVPSKRPQIDHTTSHSSESSVASPCSCGPIHTAPLVTRYSDCPCLMRRPTVPPEKNSRIAAGPPPPGRRRPGDRQPDGLYRLIGGVILVASSLLSLRTLIFFTVCASVLRLPPSAHCLACGYMRPI